MASLRYFSKTNAALPVRLDGNTVVQFESVEFDQISRSWLGVFATSDAAIAEHLAKSKGVDEIEEANFLELKKKGADTPLSPKFKVIPGSNAKVAAPVEAAAPPDGLWDYLSQQSPPSGSEPKLAQPLAELPSAAEVVKPRKVRRSK